MRIFLLCIFFINFVSSSHTQIQDCTPIDPNLCYAFENFPSINFEFSELFESEGNTVIYQSPLLADMDGDCIPDIIMAGTSNFSNTEIRLVRNIIIMDSQSGRTKTVIPTAYYNWFTASSYVVADVDSDGKVEIIVAIADHILNRGLREQGKLVCYNLDGSIKWVSDEKYGQGLEYAYGGTPSLADFNQDGIPELYIYNEIYNARTGVKLVDGGDNGKGMVTAYQSGGSNSLSIAGYFDDNDDDLELAAGYTIYKVNIVNPNGQAGNSMTPFNFSLNGEFIDGFTSMADIDLDGKMDVIVTSFGDFPVSKLYVYTLSGNQTTLLASVSPPRGLTNCCLEQIGPPVIGNLADNDKPTICVVRPSKLLAYDYDGTDELKLLWDLPTNDKSGTTGLTIFDFDQDGFHELVYRDEEQLRIINARTNPPTDLVNFPCFSGTGLEHPIVGDIDNSGVTKICVACGAASGNNRAFIGKLKVFGAQSVQQQWAPSRGIWNQYNYHIFNVNDNLTIPQKMINNAIFQDGFFNSFYVQQSLITEDKQFIQKVPDLNIAQGNFSHCIEYNSATESFEILLTIQNNSNASRIFDAFSYISIYNGDPLTNGRLVDKVSFDSTIPRGQRTTITIPLNPNFQDTILYLVVNYDGGQLGSQYDGKGYLVLECSYDNNIVQLDINDYITFIDDEICQGTAYPFFGRILEDEGKYVHSASRQNACDAITVLNLISVEALRTNLDITLCENDSVFISNRWYSSDTIFTQFLTAQNGCDSILNVKINQINKYASKEDVTLCSGDSIFVDNSWYFKDTILERIVTLDPCPILDAIQIKFNNSYSIFDKITRCGNELIQYQNQMLTDDGIYTFRYQTAQGCDSMYTVELINLALPNEPLIIPECSDKFYTMSVDVNDSWSILWSNSQTDRETNFNENTNGFVTLRHDTLGCQVQYNFFLPFIPDIEDIPVLSDTTIFPGQKIIQSLGLDDALWSATWTPVSIFDCSTCLENVLTTFSDIEVQLLLRHISGCTYNLRANVLLDDSAEIVLPNIFSPDGSVLNNRLNMGVPESFQVEEIHIYDRWGNMVFRNQNPDDISWDGSFNGQKLPSGVYIYFVKYQDPAGNTKFKTGDITIIR